MQIMHEHTNIHTKLHITKTFLVQRIAKLEANHCSYTRKVQ